MCMLGICHNGLLLLTHVFGLVQNVLEHTILAICALAEQYCCLL